MSTFHAWLLAGMALGQAASPPSKPAEVEAASNAAPSALEGFQRDAEQYVIEIQSAKPSRLELMQRPLLHWGNPARNGEDGAVYVWTKDGRPEVVGSVFTYRDRRDRIMRKHAFHSLSEQPLAATFGSRLVWSPKTPGVRFAPVAGAQAPAEDARRRLNQMRNLARQFAVQMIDLQEAKTELRLMTQPILRYQPTAGITADGAIFAFAVGTDPEALLILEARQHGESLRWEHALARFHFVTLIAQHQGDEVWRAAADPDMMRTVFGSDPQQREKTYYSVMAPP
jgi:hypothetical protein